ncbi:transposase (plasmid) [Roseomonas marmotae]|nr:transposase [Roseomonas marmotae]
MADQLGFFDVDERYAALSAAGDPLERLAAVVDFEIVRPVLDLALARSDRSRGGRPPYDAVLMFRILVLQALCNLSDGQAEFQLRDRLSFMRFAGFGLHQAVPDAKTTANSSSWPVPSRGCSAASTRSWRPRAFSPWAGRSSTPP